MTTDELRRKQIILCTVFVFAMCSALQYFRRFMQKFYVLIKIFTISTSVDVTSVNIDDILGCQFVSIYFQISISTIHGDRPT